MGIFGCIWIKSHTDFEPHQTDTFSVTVSDKLSGTTVFTPDIDEPLPIVKNFDPSLKYASFKVSRDVDVGLKSSARPAANVRSAFDVLMQSCNSTKSPTTKDQKAERFTGKIYIK